MRKVTYQAAESRNGNYGVDFMICTVSTDDEEIELYAEMENPTWDEEKQEFEDEAATYDELKAEILRQAAEHGIAATALKFYYDE